MTDKYAVVREWVVDADSVDDAIKKSKNWKHDTVHVVKLKGNERITVEIDDDGNAL